MASAGGDGRQIGLHKKLPQGHFLANPENMRHFLQWNTFFRRNLHRFATDFLGLKLHLYQVIMLYLMGASKYIAVVASRSTAKSFVIAIYSCCRAILWPRSKIVLTSATKGQSKLIVSEKIRNELMMNSPMLRREIRSIKDNQNDVVIYFRNGSTITVVPASPNGRGYRSTCCIREEFRMIDKRVEDSVIAPFQIIRTPPYMMDEYYSGNKDLLEESIDIYISSSWMDNGHWMWGIVDQAFDGMMRGEPMCALAFDESLILKHNIKSIKSLLREKKKQDALTWRIEFLNERVKEDENAYFSYEMLHENQRAKKAFYPRRNADVLANRRNQHAIPRQAGEVRVVSCDMAFVENKRNDNSVFSCIRLLPEFENFKRGDSSDVEVNNGYRRIVSYMESVQGGDTARQALRIRQLYEDFDADYIVLDLRNAGIAVYDMLARVMYDEERDREYPPLSCMNDDKVAARVFSDGARPCIYVISASLRLNSDIAQGFWRVLNEQRIDLLVSFEAASEEILPRISDYMNAPDADTQLFYEGPFLETQALVSETTSLVYEKNQQTGALIIKERGSNRKDRYTSVSYGSYFAGLLEQDLLGVKDEYEYMTLIN